MTNHNVICMIPARIGSQRFKQKNLALIENKTVLEWGIMAAKKSKIFDRIIVNGDDSIFRDIAHKNDVDFFLRDKNLGSSETKSDEVIIDFLNHFKGDFIVWFNAIAPLQRIDDIKNFVEVLSSKKYQSLFAVRSQYVQTLYNEKPLNFNYQQKFEKTQDLNPSKIFIPSLMGWNIKSFIDNYHENGYGFFSGNVGYVEVSSLSSLVIKKEEDFRLIRSVVEGFKSYNSPIKYFSN